MMNMIKLNRERAAEITEAFSGKRIVVLGDVMLVDEAVIEE